MPKRSYGQYCALARAFDVIGERWTPLLLRELATGPRRYADLQDALPGVGTSLLSQRLKELEADGVVVKRFLSPPAARSLSQLPHGREERFAGIDRDRLRSPCRRMFHQLGRQFLQERRGMAGEELAVFLSAERIAERQCLTGACNGHVE